MLEQKRINLLSGVVESNCFFLFWLFWKPNLNFWVKTKNYIKNSKTKLKPHSAKFTSFIHTMYRKESLEGFSCTDQLNRVPQSLRCFFHNAFSITFGVLKDKWADEIICRLLCLCSFAFSNYMPARNLQISLADN